MKKIIALLLSFLIVNMALGQYAFRGFTISPSSITPADSVKIVVKEQFNIGVTATHYKYFSVDTPHKKVFLFLCYQRSGGGIAPTMSETYTIPPLPIGLYDVEYRFSFCFFADSCGKQNYTDTFYTNFTVNYPAAIKKIEENNITLSPNPATTTLQIDFDRTISARATILNLQGAVLQTFYINNESNSIINVADLPKGVYLLQLQTDEGLLRKRFVKW